VAGDAQVSALVRRRRPADPQLTSIRGAAHLPYEWRIVIADNASNDRTPAIAAALCEQLDRLSVLRLERKGRASSCARRIRHM
jgi:glycosyltransferase involved in cell wall biosynthesis